MRTLFAALLVSLTSPSAQAGDPAGAVTVAPRNLKPAGGHLRCLAFRSERGFPDARRHAAAEVSVQATSSEAACRFTGLAQGVWAFAFIHDANDDGELDTNLFGVPTEGYGFSRDASGTFGPPDFEEAALVVGAEPLTLRPRVRY